MHHHDGEAGGDKVAQSLPGSISRLHVGGPTSAGPGGFIEEIRWKTFVGDLQNGEKKLRRGQLESRQGNHFLLRIEITLQT